MNIIRLENSERIFTFPVSIVRREQFEKDTFFFSRSNNGEFYISSKKQENQVLNINNIISNNYFLKEVPYVNTLDINVIFPMYREIEMDKFLLDCYIFINGKKIHIGSYELDSKNIIATDKVISVNNVRYYENICVSIPDPFDIVYSDEWREFREVVCGENQNQNTNETQLIIDLYVKNGDSIVGDYKNGYTNFVITNTDEHLSLKLNFDSDFNVVQTIKYNNIYNHDLGLYLKEVYNIDIEEVKVVMECVLKDENNIYKIISNTVTELVDKFTIKKSEFELDWSYWKPGLVFMSTFNILAQDDEEIFHIISNELPLTLDNFAYILGKEKINLNLVDMEIYNIDVVNKVEKKIYNITNPGEDKSKVINNVFINSSPLGEVNIYKNVVQNILLPLNGFKNKVKVFQLNIEGILFNEIGRNSSGVIFSIDSNIIPAEIANGNYYILNENKELVTTGKYNII
jgi:hypothetical protein